MNLFFAEKGIGFGIKKYFMILENAILDLKDKNGKTYYWCNYKIFCKKRPLFCIPLFYFLRKGEDFL